ncbi:hypothetical protein CR513_40062, partial [Mucuna pruriens]
MSSCNLIMTPLFKGQNYDYWKKRMISFFDASHIDMWGAIENGDHIHLHDDEYEYEKVHSSNFLKKCGTPLAYHILGKGL